MRALSAKACAMLEPLVENMFGAAQKAVAEQAAHASGSPDEGRLVDFRREIERKKSAVMADFIARIARGFAGLEQPRSATARRADALELVSHESMERQLLVAGGVSRVRNEWRRNLAQLQERLQAVTGEELADQDNPLDPAAIANAFLEACRQIEADMKLLRLLCNQFDAHVLGNLQTCYHDSNRLLIDARVLPDLERLAAPPPEKRERRPLTPQPAGEKPPEQTVAAPGASVGGPDGSAASIAASGSPQGGGVDVSEIAGLLRRVRAGAGVPGGAPIAAGGGLIADAIGGSMGMAAPSPAPARLVSGGQLAGMIADLQGESGWLGGGEGRALDIRGALAAVAASRGAMSLGEADDDTVNIVTMLFDTIAGDRNLPAEFQLLLARLQLPILKLALLDRSFFADREHPARQLLNAIARAGSGWDAHAGETRDALLEQTGELVDEVAAHASADGAPFAAALERLQQLLERADQRAVKLERRSSERAVADARLAAARDAVHEVMKSRLEGNELPVPVLEFFTHDWQRVLQLFWLRKGIDSPEWRDAVAMMDDLAASAVTPADAAARAALEAGLPDIYRRLESALTQTQSHSADADARVEVIRALHRSQLAPPEQRASAEVVPIERARIQPPPMIPPRNPQGAAPRPEPQPDPPPAALMFESLERADAVAVGTWFEYEEKATQVTRRCKLSARVDATRTLLFCDRFGMPVAEKSRKLFAYELQTGVLRAIEDTPLVERAMERIADELRQVAAAG